MPLSCRFVWLTALCLNVYHDVTFWKISILHVGTLQIHLWACIVSSCVPLKRKPMRPSWYVCTCMLQWDHHDMLVHVCYNSSEYQIFKPWSIYLTCRWSQRRCLRRGWRIWWRMKSASLLTRSWGCFSKLPWPATFLCQARGDFIPSVCMYVKHALRIGNTVNLLSLLLSIPLPRWQAAVAAAWY